MADLPGIRNPIPVSPVRPGEVLRERRRPERRPPAGDDRQRRKREPERDRDDDGPHIDEYA